MENIKTAKWPALIGAVMFLIFNGCGNNNVKSTVVVEELTDPMSVISIGPSVLPTKEEINSINSKLPVLVAEGTMGTKVEYNEQTMVETFTMISQEILTKV